MNIKIDKIGKILKGDYTNWYIKFEDDAINTGGYLILYNKNQDFTGEGYDCWVENYEELTRFYEASNWEIEWIKFH